MPSSESEQFNLLDQLAEEFAERLRRGERPSLEEYTDRYPELADDIRELFPAMVKVEQVDEGKIAQENALKALGPTRSLQQIGDYRILGVIGRGGMGVVYEAEQISLGRRVALKVLPRHVAADRLTLERFRREARAAARLHHTNIVPVFEVGQDGDIRFYAMQFIQGQSLDGVITELRHLRIRSHSKASSQEKAKSSPETREMSPSVAHSILAGGFLPEGDVRDNRAAVGEEATEAGPLSSFAPDSSSTPTPLTSAVLPGGTQLSVAEMSHRVFHRSVAHIGRQAAGALVHAHARGVIHRDIKPSNLLLDTDGVVWVTDFGLAKAEDDGLTQTGDVLGTIRYMAPERFLGQADPRSDIYALGLTLYELLVLRPAFDSPNRLALIEQVRSVDPPRPRSIDPRIPLDLETIVLKAVEKDAKARYASADAMSEDLRRFLADEPIQARQVSAPERYWRWAMRNRAIATLGGVLTALLVAVTAGSMMTAGYFQRLAGSEKKANQRLQVAQNVADGARREALEERDHSRRQAARLALDKGIALAETGEAARGLHWMLEGLKVAPAEAAEIQRVIRINLSAWSEQVHGLRHIIRVPARAVAPTTAAYRCAFSPDGRAIAIARAERLEYRDASSLEPTGKSLVFESLPEALAFSPDGKSLVTGHDQGGAQRWHVTTGARVGTPLPHGGMVRSVAYSPDGTIIVSGCSDGTIRLWGSSTGEPLGAPFNAGQPVFSVAFSPDGKAILIGTGSEGKGGSAYLWDVATQAKLAGPLPHPDTVFAVAFNPAGTTFLTACRDGTAQIWDSDTNRPHGSPLWHRQAVYGSLFTPDGATILTRPRDELSVFLWEAATGQRIGTPLWHQGPLDCMAVSPDGRTVLSGGVDESARIWEIGRNRSRPLDPSLRIKRPVIPGPQVEPRLPDYLLKKTIAYSADRTTVLTSDGGRIARLWETSTGRPLGAPLYHARNVRTVAISPDGRLAATASHDFNVGGADGNVSAIHFWDAATGRPLAPPIQRHQWVSALAFSPDGRVVASGDYGRTVRFWSAATGQPAGAPIEQRGIVFSVAFSPDGRTLAVGTVDSANEARLWDLEARRPKGIGMPHKDWVVDVAFDPEGRVLLTRSHDATARLWNAKSGEPLTDYLRNEGLPAAAFSPDGRKLATAGNLEDQVRIWDAQTGQVLPGSTLGQGSQVTALAFSPDGRVLGVGCKDGSARLWDVATAKPLGPPMVQRSTIVAVTFNQAGSALLATAADGTTRSWPLPLPISANTDQIGLRLEILTGLRMNAGQDVEKLAPLAWDESCRRLTALEGSVALAYASSVSEMDYHEARARDAEQDGNTFAERWHLDRLISLRAAEQNADSVSHLWLLHARRARAWSIAGRLDFADADYSRALQLASRSLILDWYRHRVADCEHAAQWPTALWYLDRCIAAEPSNRELYASRSRAFGRLEAESAVVLSGSSRFRQRDAPAEPRNHSTRQEAPSGKTVQGRSGITEATEAKRCIRGTQEAHYDPGRDAGGPGGTLNDVDLRIGTIRHCSINSPRNSPSVSAAASAPRSRNTPTATRSWPTTSASSSRRWSRWSRSTRGKSIPKVKRRPPGPKGSLQQIGDYRILGVIGRGGMGVVYEAEQVSLGRRVALKVLPRHVAADRLTLERFRREARAAARLHHTNIVPVFEVGQDGDIRFYAMQFIQGQSLDGVITELRHLRIQSQSKADGEEKAKSSPETRTMTPSVAHSILAGGFLPEGDVRATSQASTERTAAEPASAALVLAKAVAVGRRRDRGWPVVRVCSRLVLDSDASHLGRVAGRHAALGRGE